MKQPTQRMPITVDALGEIKRDQTEIFFFFFFLIILFIFLIQDSLQADLEFKLQSIASYRKTDYKSIWKKKKKKKKKETTGCKIINRTYKYQKYSVIARYLKVTICP